MSEKKEYKLLGMTCASCAMTVEMAVKDLETVEDVSVNLATECLSLVFANLAVFMKTFPSLLKIITRNMSLRKNS